MSESQYIKDTSINKESLPIAIPISSTDKDNELQIPIETLSPVSSHSNMNIHILNNSYSPDMYKMWRYRKTIQFVALFDLLLCLFVGVCDPNILILSLFPIAGYYGAQNYSSFGLILYSLFVSCIIVGKIMYVIHTNISVTNYVLNVFSIFIEGWLFRYIYKFIGLIDKLPEDEFNKLQNPTNYPVRVQYIWY